MAIFSRLKALETQHKSRKSSLFLQSQQSQKVVNVLIYFITCQHCTLKPMLCTFGQRQRQQQKPKQWTSNSWKKSKHKRGNTQQTGNEWAKIKCQQRKWIQIKTSVLLIGICTFACLFVCWWLSCGVLGRRRGTARQSGKSSVLRNRPKSTQ